MKNRKKGINLLPESSFNISITDVFKKYNVTPEELDKESGLKKLLIHIFQKLQKC